MKGLGTLNRDEKTESPSGILPKEYAKPPLSQRMLGRGSTNPDILFSGCSLTMSLRVRVILAAVTSGLSNHHVSSVVAPEGLPQTLYRPDPLFTRQVRSVW